MNKIERYHMMAQKGDLEALSKLIIHARRNGLETQPYIHLAEKISREAVAQGQYDKAIQAMLFLPPHPYRQAAILKLFEQVPESKRKTLLPKLKPIIHLITPTFWKSLDEFPSIPSWFSMIRTLEINGHQIGREKIAWIQQALERYEPRIYEVHFKDITVHEMLALLKTKACNSVEKLSCISKDFDEEGFWEIIQTPFWKGLKSLHCSKGLSSKAFAKLMSYFPEYCTHLDLSENQLSLSELARSFKLEYGIRHLKFLNLSQNPLDGQQDLDVAQEAKILNAIVSNLSVLDLSRTFENPHNLVALIAHLQLQQLQILNIAHNALGPSGIQRLSRYRGFSELKALSLSDNDIRDHSLTHLSHWPALKSLQILDLSHNHLHAPSLGELARSPHLQNLHILDLSYNPIQSRGLQALVGAHRWPELRELILQDTGMDDRALEALYASQWNQLQVLDLSQSARKDKGLGSLGIERFLDRPWELQKWALAYQPIGDRGVEYIAQSPNLPRLKVLDLRGVGLTTRGLRALAQSPYLKSLEVLLLDHNPLDEGLAQILASASWPELKHLSIPIHLIQKNLDLLIKSPHLPFHLRYYFASLKSE